MPETWKEYRALARQFSKGGSTSSDTTSEASKTSVRLESGQRCGVPVLSQAGSGQRYGSVEGTPVSTPGTGPLDVPRTRDRPKRACRLKRKHGKLV